jgi:hypothetical protein
MKPLTGIQAERDRISAQFDEAEDLRDYPGSYYPTLRQAEQALIAWRLKYPTEADAERVAASEARLDREAARARDFVTSFIGQGLD